MEGLLTENRIFRQRTVDIGVDLRRRGGGLGVQRPDDPRLGRGLGFAQGTILRFL